MKLNPVRLIILCILAFAGCGEDGANIFVVDIVHSLDQGRDMEMVRLPGGSFIQGSSLYPPFTVVSAPGLPPDTTFNPERPVHFVNIPSFLISTTEITREQYESIMGRGAADTRFSGEIDMPLENVTWFEAADFCNELSRTMGLTPCYGANYVADFSADGFRLPTESEWEYAARANQNLEYSFGDSEAALSLHGWYTGNSAGTTHPVARKKENGFGLYDMNGNVYEWCNDFYSVYNCGSQADPQGPESGSGKVARGGSWASTARECRSAYRLPLLPDRKYSIAGFRVVRRP